jgi:hypothetical protein
MVTDHPDTRTLKTAASSATKPLIRTVIYELDWTELNSVNVS